MFNRRRKIGSLLLRGCLSIVIFTSCVEKKTSTEVEVLSRPKTTFTSINYQGNRAPLKPLNFIKLPVGDIKATGWLKKYLLLQKEGLTGKLGEISA